MVIDNEGEAIVNADSSSRVPRTLMPSLSTPHHTPSPSNSSNDSSHSYKSSSGSSSSHVATHASGAHDIHDDESLNTSSIDSTDVKAHPGTCTHTSASLGFKHSQSKRETLGLGSPARKQRPRSAMENSTSSIDVYTGVEILSTDKAKKPRIT